MKQTGENLEKCRGVQDDLLDALRAGRARKDSDEGN